MPQQNVFNSMDVQIATKYLAVVFQNRFLVIAY